MEFNLDELSFSIRSGGCSIFFGAGLSKNSGAPLALELVDLLLSSLEIDEQEIKTIKRANLPFEAIMESFLQPPASSHILKVFKNMVPNTNHSFIAKLAKSGAIKTIVTTNFDSLMELALDEEELEEIIGYNKYYTEEQFSVIDYKNHSLPLFIKIHGCIDFPESIRTTLKHVASRRLSEHRMKVLRHLFLEGKHDIVLVMGYSCSDRFDILPQIQSIKDSKKEIVFVEHSNDKNMSGFEIHELPDMFSRFNGVSISVNTIDFIQYLWGALEDKIGGYTYKKLEHNWKGHLKPWKDFIKVRDDWKNRILGSIYENMAQFNDAIPPYLRALELLVDSKNHEAEAMLCEKIGVAYHNLGESIKANDYYMRSLHMAKKAKDKVTIARCHVNLGSVYKTEPRKRIKHCKKGISKASKLGDVQTQARGYTSAGIAYEDLRDLHKALEFHQKAVELAENSGDLAEKARSLANIGAAYANLGKDPVSAKAYAERSLEIAESIGDQSTQMTVHIGMGTICYNKQDLNTALMHFKKAHHLAISIGSKEGERLSNHGMRASGG